MGPDKQQTTNTTAPATGPLPFEPTLPVKKSKKGLIIGLVTGGVLVLGLATAAVVYAAVYNNPDNAVTDAFVKMITAKSSETNGTMTMKTSSGGTSVTMKADVTSAEDESNQQTADETITYSVGGKDFSIKAHTAVAKDALYVKLDDLNAIIDNMYGANSSNAQAIKQYYGSLIDKIDGKWVVIKYSDLDSLTNGTVKGSQVTCVLDQVNKLKTDSTFQNELKNAYTQNRFLKAESKGSDSDGNRYTLTPDQAKAKDFAKAMRNTKFFKAIDDCTNGQISKSMDNGSTSSTSSGNGTVTLDMWVDGWSHNPNKIAMTIKGASGSSSTTDMTMEYKMKLNTNPKVTIPTGQTTTGDIQTDIDKIQQQFKDMYSSSTTTDYTY